MQHYVFGFGNENFKDVIWHL